MFQSHRERLNKNGQKNDGDFLHITICRPLKAEFCQKRRYSRFYLLNEIDLKQERNVRSMKLKNLFRYEKRQTQNTSKIAISQKAFSRHIFT